MKRQIILVLALAIAAASATADAQVGGLLRKKAGEVLGKKPETAAPASPAAAPAPAGTRAAAPAAEKKSVDPLDVSALPVRQSAVQVLRDRINARDNGDWDQLPYIPAAATAAAYGLSDSARATLVETVGAALKSLVMSPAFMTEHDAFIKSEHQGVDHGLKGVVTVEDAMNRKDFKAIEAIQVRQMVAMNADMALTMPADFLKEEFQKELPRWKERAADPKNSGRVKYQKMVAAAKPIEALTPADEKFRRGYAVIKSIDAGGPETEEAVFALSTRVKQEREQAAYDSHSLKGQLKQQLTAFVAIASKVNFNAPTVEKGKKTVFVNAADERQGAIWKGCFRAGEAATAAAVKVARAWLTEL
jgi:hypothetical protein